MWARWFRKTKITNKHGKNAREVNLNEVNSRASATRKNGFIHVPPSLPRNANWGKKVQFKEQIKESKPRFNQGKNKSRSQSKRPGPSQRKVIEPTIPGVASKSELRQSLGARGSINIMRVVPFEMHQRRQNILNGGPENKSKPMSVNQIRRMVQQRRNDNFYKRGKTQSFKHY